MKKFLVVFLFLSLLGLTFSQDPLNIWLVAHSHDDTGWLRTIDEYYIYEVQYILDSVVDSLSKNADRKFIQVEMAFFSRWWREQTTETQEKVRGLVASGQLEFVNGGWCMNDEAVATYYAMIDQMTLGHEFLTSQFGDSGKPSIGWHIDPFGHSNVMPTMYNLMGFEAFFLNRIDYRLKLDFKESKTMEFNWQGSPSLGQSAALWSHTMDEHYCTPSGFDWEHGVTQNLPAGDGPPPIVIDPPSWATEPNDFARALEFVTEAKRRATSFQTNNILIPFGCDFTFQNANMVFKNMDRLIDSINRYSNELGATARYSSLSDYTAHVKSINTTWITRTEDFFPYADNGASYWTGYFSSRPLLKSTSRRAHAVLRNADFSFSLVKALFGGNHETEWEQLNLLRAPEAVVQHHDGVTGTFRRLVGEDYLKLLANGINTGSTVISQLLGAFVAGNSFDPELTHDVTYLQEQLSQGRRVPVVVFNSLPFSRRQFVNITLLNPNVAVTDPNAVIVPYQVNPHFEGNAYTLFFLADLPPLGYATYYISPAKNTENLGKIVPLVDNFILENEHIALEFDNATGLLFSYRNKRTSAITLLTQQYVQYTSNRGGQSSGAYIFRPTGAATVIQPLVEATVITGNYVQQIHQVYRQLSIRQDIRLYNGLSFQDGARVEILATIGPVGSDNEIATRFVSGINNLENGASKFFTDNNGFEFQPRINLPNGRPGDSDNGVRIAGNFYPAVSRAYIQDANQDLQFTVVTQMTHAAASLSTGQLELLLHRYCSVDDSRGMSEALDDSSIVQFALSFSIETFQESTRYHQRVSKELAFSPSLSFGNPDLSPQWTTPFHQFLSNALPENVFLLSLNARDSSADQVAIRLYHTFEAGSHPSLGQPITVNLASMFANLVITFIEERTLTLLDVISQPDPNFITLNPSQIRTFVVRFANK